MSCILGTDELMVFNDGSVCFYVWEGGGAFVLGDELMLKHGSCYLERREVVKLRCPSTAFEYSKPTIYKSCQSPRKFNT